MSLKPVISSDFCKSQFLTSTFIKRNFFCVSLAPVLTFCSKCLAFHSYAEDLIHPLVNRVPTLNPAAKTTDMQDTGQKVPFSTLMG